MELKTQCPKAMEHRWEYRAAVEGPNYYFCFLCGAVEFEMEEHHGG